MNQIKIGLDCHSKMTPSVLKSAFLGKKISFPFSPQVRILFSHLLKNGDEVRIVGGSVRDFLAGKKIDNFTNIDFDLACQYLPEKTIEILKQYRIKIVASGLKYGTITAIIDEKQFQITTLRKDIRNFGRDCDVQFVDNYLEDAKRRDFTINAMSVDFSGQLYDYFGGEDDLKNKIVRFIGDANTRIKEDYLRILRFFRFSCQYAKIFDESGLSACIKYKNHLSDLSPERIRLELFKIFECENRENLFLTIKTMFDTGILQLVFYSLCQRKIDGVKNLLDLEKFVDYKFKSLIFLSILSGRDNPRLSLSNAEKKYLKTITSPNTLLDFKISKKDILKLLLKFDKKELIDIFTVQLVLNSDFKNLINDFLKVKKIISSSLIPNFPINGHDLIDLKIKPQDIGKTLQIAQNYWWEHDFDIDKQKILSFINNRRA